MEYFVRSINENPYTKRYECHFSPDEMCVIEDNVIQYVARVCDEMDREELINEYEDVKNAIRIVNEIDDKRIVKWLKTLYFKKTGVEIKFEEE